MARREFQDALPWLEEAVSMAEAVGSKYLAATFSGEVAICYFGSPPKDDMPAVTEYWSSQGVINKHLTDHWENLGLREGM
jgi:hypothetical protein